LNKKISKGEQKIFLLKRGGIEKKISGEGGKKFVW
jgi:hypothetical protein